MFPTKNSRSRVKEVKPRGELTERFTPNSSDYCKFISSSTAMTELTVVSDSQWTSSGYHQQIKFSNENEEDQENYPETENCNAGTTGCQKKSFNEEMYPLTTERFFQGGLQQLSSLFSKSTASYTASERAGMSGTSDYQSYFKTSLKLNESADNECDEDFGSSTINSEVSSIDELSVNGLNTFLKSFHQVTETNIALSLESFSDNESEGLESKSTSQCSTILSQRSADLESDVQSEKTGISYSGMMISNADSNGNEVYYDCVPDLEADSIIGNVPALAESVDGKELVNQVHEVAEGKLDGIVLENLQSKNQPVEAHNGVTITFEASEVHMTEAHANEENNKVTLGSILSSEGERREESNQGPEMDAVTTNLCPPDMLSSFAQENGTIASPNISDQPNIQQKESIYQTSLFMEALEEVSQIFVKTTDIISENGTFVIECNNNSPSNYFKLKESWQSREEENQCNAHDKSFTHDKNTTLNLEGEQAHHPPLDKSATLSLKESQQTDTYDYMITQRSQSKDSPSNLMKFLNQANEKFSNTMTFGNSKHEVDDSTNASTEDVSLASGGESGSVGSFICPETEEELDSFLNHVNPFLTIPPLETVQEQMSRTELTLRMQHSEDLLSLKYLDSEVNSTETDVEDCSISIQESLLLRSQEERSEGNVALMGSLTEEMPLGPHLIDDPKQQWEGLSLHIIDADSIMINQQNDSPKKSILGQRDLEEELSDVNQKTSEHTHSPDDNTSGKACEDKLLNNEESTTISETHIDSLTVLKSNSGKVENLYVQSDQQDETLSKGLDPSGSALVSCDKECTSISETLVHSSEVDSTEVVHEVSNTTENEQLNEPLKQHESLTGLDLSVSNDQECVFISETSNVIEQLNQHMALRKGSIELDPLESLSDLESQLISKAFELLEKEGPFQLEICDLFCILEESGLSATSVFQIMLVLFLSQPSKWSACLSIQFIHLVKKVAHENLESSIDEGTSSEEIALIHYYYILNQLAKARASLEVNTLYAERFASLVQAYGPTEEEKNIFVHESLLQQFSGRPSNINEEKIDSASIHLWNALHSSINSILELKKKEGTVPPENEPNPAENFLERSVSPENESNPTENVLERHKSKVDGSLHVSQQGQADFTAPVDKSQTNIFDNKELIARNNTDSMIQSIDSFNQIQSLVSNFAEYFSHDSTSILQVAYNRNFPEEANKENKQATGNEILKIEFVSNENALQHWDFSPEAVEVVVNDFEPGLCENQDIGDDLTDGVQTQELDEIKQSKDQELVQNCNVDIDTSLEFNESATENNPPIKRESDIDIAEESGESGQSENVLTVTSLLPSCVEHEMDKNEWSLQILPDNVRTQELGEIEQPKDQKAVQSCNIDIFPSIEYEGSATNNNGLDPSIMQCKSYTDLAELNHESGQTEDVPIVTLLSSCVEHDMENNVESLDILADNVSTLELGEIEQTRNQETVQNCRGDTNPSVEYDDSTTEIDPPVKCVSGQTERVLIATSFSSCAEHSICKNDGSLQILAQNIAANTDACPAEIYDVKHTENSGVDPPVSCKPDIDLALESKKSGETKYVLDVASSSFADHDLGENDESLQILAEKINGADSNPTEFREIKRVENVCVDSLVKCKANIDPAEESDVSGHSETVLIVSSLSGCVKNDKGQNDESLPCLAKKIGISNDLDPTESHKLEQSENSVDVVSSSGVINNDAVNGILISRNVSLTTNISGFENLKTLECALSTCFSEDSYLLNLKQSLSSDSQDIIQEFEAKFGPMEEVDVSEQVEDFLRRRFEFSQAASELNIDHSNKAEDIEENMNVKSKLEDFKDLVNDLNDLNDAESMQEEAFQNHVDCSVYTKEFNGSGQTEEALTQFVENDELIFSVEPLHISGQTENVLFVKSLSGLAEKDEVKTMISQNTPLAQSISGFDQLKTLECALSTCLSQDSIVADIEDSASADSADIIQQYEVKFGPIEEVDDSKQVEDFLHRRFNPVGISHVLYVAEGAENETRGKLIYLEDQGSAYFCESKVGANQQVDEVKKVEEQGTKHNEESRESCLHEKVIMSDDSQRVIEENKALQNNCFLDADEAMQENTKEMDRNDQDSQSSESSLDMISKYEAKFGPMPEVDESELALGFLNRFLALQAGGHFPDANVNAISLPEPVISVDEDDQSCVEVDLVHGYVKKELFNNIKVKRLEVEHSVKSISKTMRPDGEEDKEKHTTQPFVVQKAVSDGRDDENSQKVRIRSKAEEWKEKNQAFVKDFVAKFKNAVSDARDEENDVGLGACPSEIRQGIDETPIVENTMLPDIQVENSSFPLKHTVQPKESMMLPVYIESRREKTSSINRNESETDDLSVVSSLSLFDFECQVRPQLSEPPCEIIVQETEQSKIVHVKKDFAHSALSLFSKFAAMEEKLLKLEAHHAKVALQKHGVVMLGWKSPWNNHPTSHLRALSAPFWTSNLGCINGVAAAASLSRRRRAAGFQAPQKKLTLDRARAFDCGERIDIFSFHESINRSGNKTRFDGLPWEKRNVRQRFLSEKSIETRNWFGSLVMTRGNDRYHQPVSHPSSVELDWETFPYPGSWEEIWFTPWQAFRANPNNLLIDQKFSNDSEDSEDLFDERPQIGIMVTVRQNVNESLTRVSYMHSSNLRRSRWRRKFYPYGTFPY